MWSKDIDFVRRIICCLVGVERDRIGGSLAENTEAIQQIRCVIKSPFTE